jgi:hypothetical protein
MLTLLFGAVAFCFAPRTFFVSISPDGKRSVILKSLYLIPDWTIWMKVRDHSWATRNVYTSGDVPEPGYTEAFWKGNSKVLVIECNSGLNLSYDFSSNTFSDKDFEKTKSILANCKMPRTHEDVNDDIGVYCQWKTYTSRLGLPGNTPRP